MIKEFIVLVLKGAGMGAANVIPGVSGGTIALITGIFEKLIDSIKSFNVKALELLFTGKFKDFAKHINLGFLIAVFLGIGISIITFAKLLDYLFLNYPVYIWSFFFGLILASVYFVGKTISKWSFSIIFTFIFGTTIAVTITLMTPATENPALWYLFICGIIAACCMILPGLSGSFILILLGNYQLVMINAINDLNIKILAPVVIGAAFGLLVFSHFLSWIFKNFKDQTISVLSGFILGSLAILWPWKNEITESFAGKVKVVGYTWNLPATFNLEVIFAIGLMILGIISIWLIEKLAEKKA
jgi:putative membrane protein